MPKDRLDARTLAGAVAINDAEERDSDFCADQVPGRGKWTQKSNCSGVGTAEADAESAGFVEAGTDCRAVGDADPADLVKWAVYSAR
jgi:hypothetical protein